MLWDEMTWQQLAQKRKEVADRRWKYTRKEAKWDVLVKALQTYDNHTLVGAMLAALDADDITEIVRELQKYLTWKTEARREDGSSADAVTDCWAAYMFNEIYGTLPRDQDIGGEPKEPSDALREWISLQEPKRR